MEDAAAAAWEGLAGQCTCSGSIALGRGHFVCSLDVFHLHHSWSDAWLLDFPHFLPFFAGMKAETSFLVLLAMLILFLESVSSSYAIVSFSGCADQGHSWSE